MPFNSTLLSNGTNYPSQGTSVSETVSAISSGNRRCIVMRMWNCGAHGTLTGLTLGGQSPDYTYDSGGSQWYHTRMHMAIWMETAISNMSGTSLSGTLSSSGMYVVTVTEYYDIDQNGPRDADTAENVSSIPSQTTVSGDHFLSYSADRYDNDGISYTGSGTERSNYVAQGTNTEGSGSVADVDATGASTTDTYDNMASYGYAILIPDTGGGGGPSPGIEADLANRGFGRGFGRGLFRGGA